MLEFAKKKSDVNWIFKEHPASRYYPTRDLSLQEHFECCPNHIVFLDAESSFNLENLLYLADAISTVLGTAGVEFPAAEGIPSIITGDTFYDGFGFTIEPSSREEYFQVLRDIEKIERLTEEQRYMAKIVFLYIQRYCHVPFDWVPAVSYDETKSPDLNTYYWDLIVQQYHEKPGILMDQFNDYVRCVEQSDFTRLVNFSALEVASNK